MKPERSIVEAPILALPTELLVIIISHVSLHDRVKLRNVSRRLRSACETPSLWHEFVWDYYDIREELCVNNVLKVCGEHIRKLAFPGYLSPKLEVLQYCNNVRHLSLPLTVTLSPDQLGEVVQHMKQLHTLDVCCTNLKRLLLIGANLKELTLYVCERCELFVASVNEWVNMKFRPPQFNVVFIGNQLPRIHGLIENWQLWNSKVPASHVACLKFYTRFKIPLNIYPILPAFQLHFGQSAVLPFVQAKQCGISGMDCLQLTDCCNDGKTMCRAAKSLSYLSNNTITNLHFVTHFDIAASGFLLPVDLETIAASCPNLQQLRIWNCHQCLKNLQGLCAIANHCHNLQGLNIMGISVSDVENQIKLWEILSTINLIHLVADFCIVGPCVADAEYEGKLISLYKKCCNLLALESLCLQHHCSDCKALHQVNSLILGHFPSLKYCKLSNRDLTSFQDIITSCKELKCLRIRASSLLLSLAPKHNLEQLYLQSINSDVSDTFMSSVSAHGGLVHVFLSVASVSVVGISILIENSPKLLTFQCLLERMFDVDSRRLTEVEFLQFKDTLKEKHRHCSKVFSVGGYRVMTRTNTQFSLNSTLLEHTDLVFL